MYICIKDDREDDDKMTMITISCCLVIQDNLVEFGLYVIEKEKQ